MKKIINIFFHVMINTWKKINKYIDGRKDDSAGFCTNNDSFYKSWNVQEISDTIVPEKTNIHYAR